jgi:hypothetical protein
VNIGADEMSCYLKHLEPDLIEAGIAIDEMDKKERRKVDMAVKRMFGAERCPEAWKAVQAELLNDKEAFIARLKKEMER